MDYVLGLSGHTITPENFLGIEINPRAAAIAQLVLWIGYLQWHFRVNGEGKVPPEPVLRDVKTIENRDALITWDKKVLERDEHGKPLTIWDGTTMKRHPVTDELVPDETGQMELYRYVNPKQSKWPKASFIIGNPPFIGNKRMRLRLGDGYTEAVRKAYSKTGDSVDFVMYWWDVAGKAAVSATRRFGFITTNSITQPFNRAVIEDSKSRLLYAIADHPWVDGVDGAAVRIALTCAGAEKAPGKLAIVVNETELPDGYGEKAVQLRFETVTEINSDLAEGADTSVAIRLKSNANLSHQGMTLVGKGFRLTPDEARRFSASVVANDPIIRPYIIGRDITGRREERYVIDAFGKSELELRDQYPALYQVLLNNVKPERDQNHRASYRQKWWIYAEPRQDLRRSAVGLTRFIATCRTAKHRIFCFEPILTLPDAKVIFVGLEDGIHLGILTSKIHQCWAFRTGGWLGVGNDSNYNHSDCFGKFPFPADVPEPLKARIRAEAEALDALRKQVLAAHDDLTLTGLYNALEALKAGRALTDKERDVHDRGLVTLIRQHHDAIDTAVAEAYGWPADLSDEDILTRLVALNKTRAAEEAKGVIRWLRPEFQSPGATAPQVNATLDLGDAPVAAPAAIIPWPKTLAEQVSAVAAILAAAPIPQHPRDIARSIQGTNAKGVTPVLDALTAIGQARKLADGRYAA